MDKYFGLGDTIQPTIDAKTHNDLQNKLVVHITIQVGIVDHWGLNYTELIRDPLEAVFNVKFQLCNQRKKENAGGHLESFLGQV